MTGAIATSTLTEHLDRLYCQHVLSGMWAQAVYFRLEGLPQVVLQDVLRQIAEEHLLVKHLAKQERNLSDALAAAKG